MKKEVMLSMAMTALLALPTMTSAQINRSLQGGLFGYQKEEQNDGGVLNRAGSRSSTAAIESGQIGLYPQNLGTVPLGSGLVFLTIAGAGYALAKRRKENK